MDKVSGGMTRRRFFPPFRCFLFRRAILLNRQLCLTSATLIASWRRTRVDEISLKASNCSVGSHGLLEIASDTDAGPAQAGAATC